MNRFLCSSRSMAVTSLVLAATAARVFALLPNAGAVQTSLGVDAGLAVVVGTEDGVLESGMHNGGKVLVHGLTTDAAKCSQARTRLLNNQLYGLVSVELVESYRRLPYYENLINFLVADLDELSAQGLTKKEVMRVLAYDGKAYLREGGDWSVLHKPIPAGAGEHTHFFADAAKSNIIDDTIAGPPNAYRFVGKPASRSDDNGHRVGKKVVFYRAGNGRAQKHPDGPERLQPELLYAKDAFSGVFLWAREIGDCAREWGVVGQHYFWVWNHLTDYDSLYLDAVDVEDGSTVHRLPIHRGKWRDRDKREAEPFDTASSFRSRMALFAVDGLLGHTFIGKLWIRDEATADEKWSRSLAPGHCYRTVLCWDGVVVAVVSEHGTSPSLSRADPFVSIIGYDLRDGNELWRIDGEELWQGSDFAPTQEKPVVTVPWMSGANEGQVAFPAWRIPLAEVGNPSKEYDVLFSLLDIKTGNLSWRRSESFQNKLSHASWYYDYYVKGDKVFRCLLEWGEVWNRATGDRMDEASWPNKVQKSQSCEWRGLETFNLRVNCNGGTATQKYLILDAYHPWESVLSFEWKNHGVNKENALPTYYLPRLFSNGCLHYQTPSYGSIYNTQGDCSCASYTGCANATFSRYPTAAVADNERVATAYAEAIAQSSVPEQTIADQSTVGFDWQLPRERVGMVYAGPFTYGRGDGNYEVWGYSRHRTPTLQVGDLTIDGYVHEHRITATRNGDVVWHFIAGGRLASRGGPVSDGTRVYFGSHDGYVYALNVEDGSLAWRTLAAVDDLRIVGFGQIESAWPIFCVLLHEGAIYTSSGRHQEVDGGVRFFKINAEDGSVVWHTKFVSGMLTNKEHDNCTGVKSVSLQNGDLAIENNRLIVHPHHVDHIPLDRQIPENMKAPGHQYRKFQTPIYSIDLDSPRDSVKFPGGFIPPNPVVESGPEYNPSVRTRRYMARVVGRFVRMTYTANGVRITAPPRMTWQVELYTVSGRTLHRAKGRGSKFEPIAFNELSGGYHIIRLKAEGLRPISKGVLVVR